MDNSIVTIIISSITGVVTFFVGQNRARKEIEGLQLNNIEQSLDIYNRIIDDLKGQIDDLLTKVDSLEKKVDELHKENTTLRTLLEKYTNKDKKK